MNNLPGRLVVYLAGGASIFVILFGIRGSASIINPILLAMVITITVLPVPSRLTKRGMPGWLALVLSILMVVLLLGLEAAIRLFDIRTFTAAEIVYHPVLGHVYVPERGGLDAANRRGVANFSTDQGLISASSSSV